jgi:hypothetical protein
MTSSWDDLGVARHPAPAANYIEPAPDFPYFSSWRRIELGKVRQCFPCGRCRGFPYTNHYPESDSNGSAETIGKTSPPGGVPNHQNTESHAAPAQER